MAYGRISSKQQEILDYIKNEILNRGFPPAVREICEAVNLKSTSSVHSHLEALEKNGYIRRDATKPRAIEIIDVASEIQKFTDTGISMELLFDQNKEGFKAKDLYDAIHHAWKKGIKSIYYIRSIKKNETLEVKEDDCVACSG